MSRVNDKIRDMVANHLALMLSIAGATFVALRVQAVSGGSLETAAVILQTQGTATIIFSTFAQAISVIPLILVPVLLQLRFNRGQVPTREDKIVFAGLMLLVVTLTPAALFLVLLPTAPFAILVLALDRIRGWRHGSRLRAAEDDSRPIFERERQMEGLKRNLESLERRAKGLASVVRLMAGLTVVVALVITLALRPWLPREEIAVGDKKIQGYVLEGGDEEIVILQNEPRGVVRVRGEVTRTYCVERRPKNIFLRVALEERPLTSLLLSQNLKYPVCK